MDKKFDVVIGNPPYQNDAQGASGRSEPIYHHFMDAAYELSDKVVLITPARFLSNSGQTPAAWNKKMLADTHLMVAHYESNSNEIFPGTDIKGGIAVTYRDTAKEVKPIGVFLGDTSQELNSVLRKVPSTNHQSFSNLVSSRALYRFSDMAMLEHSEIAAIQGNGTGSQITPPSLGLFADILFYESEPNDENTYVQLLGLLKGKRVRRWIRKDYTNQPESLDRWKVLVAKSNGSGSFGEVLSSPVVAEPGLGHTDTFLTVGSFAEATEAQSCLVYIKTKFVRALLSILKTTQDNPKGKWKYVPLQDFTSTSDIDWSKSVAEIDQQLYKKYKLSPEEIDFIESNVQAMD
ncbi:Eco57I restriction-modification methylase domain-containing protein [Glutamicibacter sp. BSL13]